MPITAVRSNEAMDDGLPPAATDVPAWMLNRRERRMSGEISAGFENAQETNAAETIALNTEAPADASPPFSFPPPLGDAKAKRKPPVIKVVKSAIEAKLANATWLKQWVSSQGLIGVSVSLFLHATILVSLAFIIMSNVTQDDTVQVFGIPGETDEIGDDILIDTSTTLDPGEAAPLQMSDVGQVLDTIGTSSEIGEVQHGVSGGKGKGLGGSGDGTGGLTLKVPGHAQTKGSFSAWTDPRDPMPLLNYYIVIQIRVPLSIKKYRATDLSGLVTGTDKFKQEIRYKSGDVFPVEDGIIEIRIQVPGGAQRVRDTIHIESKMLKEKQTFEIEF